jgi:hypothetical protein
MAQGQRPQYDVFVSREIEARKNFYTKIGSAWNVHHARCNAGWGR